VSMPQRVVESPRDWLESTPFTKKCARDGDASPATPRAAPVMIDDIHEFHHPKSPNFVHPSKWCVTLDDLEYFEREVMEVFGRPACDVWPADEGPDRLGPNIQQVVDRYIKPVTKKQGGMSWALMRNPDGLKCDVFATHCWAEGVYEFVGKVRRNWPRGAKHLWACFLANPQNGNLASLLHVRIQDSPFARALRQAKHFLVVPNSKVSIYTRLWCVYEASLAIRHVRRGLVSTLPTEAPFSKIARKSAPGLLLGAVCFFGSVFFVGRHAAHIFPPVVWLLFAMYTSLLGRYVVRWWRREHGDRNVTLNDTAEIMVAWLNLASVCFGFGLVHQSLQGRRREDHWAWEDGEGWGCTFVTVSLVLMHLGNIYKTIKLAVQRSEAGQLEFTSVREAKCTEASDQEKITEAIKGKEDFIDEFVRLLTVVGRFDEVVAMNSEYGMTAERARAGLANLRVLPACCAWSYWWVTDLSARSHHILATESVLASCAAALTVQWCVGERAIFAIDTLFHFGFLYLATTVFFANVIWHSTPLRDHTMVWKTSPLQAAFILCMALVNLLYYTGSCAGRGDHAHASSRCAWLDCESEGESDSCGTDDSDTGDGERSDVSCDGELPESLHGSRTDFSSLWDGEGEDDTITSVADETADRGMWAIDVIGRVGALRG